VQSAASNKLAMFAPSGGLGEDRHNGMLGAASFAAADRRSPSDRPTLSSSDGGGVPLSASESLLAHSASSPHLSTFWSTDARCLQHACPSQGEAADAAAALAASPRSAEEMARRVEAMQTRVMEVEAVLRVDLGREGCVPQCKMALKESSVFYKALGVMAEQLGVLKGALFQVGAWCARDFDGPRFPSGRLRITG
jgi:hypothetical protein